jgi:hypothetical protein
MKRYNAFSEDYMQRICHGLSGAYDMQLCPARSIGPLEAKFLPPEIGASEFLRIFAPGSGEHIPLRIRNPAA